MVDLRALFRGVMLSLRSILRGADQHRAINRRREKEALEKEALEKK